MFKGLTELTAVCISYSITKVQIELRNWRWKNQ